MERPSRQHHHHHQRGSTMSLSSSSSLLPIYIPVMVDFKVKQKKKTFFFFLFFLCFLHTEKQTETAISAQQNRGSNRRGDHEKAESERRKNIFLIYLSIYM
jgi:hypothetical protein